MGEIEEEEGGNGGRGEQRPKLPFEELIFEELLEVDGLVVMSEGLGLERVFYRFVEAYSDERLLVLVLNVSSGKQAYYIEKYEEESALQGRGGAMRRYSGEQERGREEEGSAEKERKKKEKKKKKKKRKKQRRDDEELSEEESDEEEVGDSIARYSRVPVVMNATLNADERQQMYRRGGVVFVTSRILIVDILNGRVPIHLVSGILVDRGEAVTESSMESFILRLYRERNDTGFIKAFSENPQKLARGFGSVDRVMRSLFVKELYIYPRFHESIKAVLSSTDLECTEVDVPVTRNMKIMQECVLDLLSYSIAEVKRLNSSSDLSDFTVENALSRNFDYIISSQLDAIWHQVSAKTKQTVYDIKTLRTILTNLLEYDCVTMNHFLETLRQSTKSFSASYYTHYPDWLFTESAGRLMEVAKERVVKGKDTSKASSDGSESMSGSAGEGPAKRPKVRDGFGTASGDDGESLVLEPCPKWELLLEFLDEIEEQVRSGRESRDKNDKDAPNSRVLIFAGDERCALQLREVIQDGSKDTLTRLYRRFQKWTRDLSDMSQGALESGSSVGGSTPTFPSSSGRQGSSKAIKRKRPQRHTRPTSRFFAPPANASVDDSLASAGIEEQSRDTFLVGDYAENDADVGFVNMNINAEDIESSKGNEKMCLLSEQWPPMEDDVCEKKDPVDLLISIYHFSNDRERAFTMKFLEQFKPSFVILYQPFLDAVRTLEVFKACNPSHFLHVYQMIYSNSVEEEKFLMKARKEKAAFFDLIDRKSNMAVREDQDGKLLKKVAGVVSVGGIDPTKDTDDLSSSRKGGEAKKRENAVIVDMREFRCSLPPTLHMKGFVVKPVTLEVGDYILSKELCVERKSVNDLIGSLNSGRLYYQAELMCQFYKYPILLIEFDEGKSFSFQSEAEIRQEVRITDMSSKLTLLTIHFPKLKLIWSRNCHHTATIFDKLKEPQEEPVAEMAVAMRAGTAVTEVQDADGKGNRAVVLAEDDERYNPGPRNLLRHFPGITSKNIMRVMDNIENVSELCHKTLLELQTLLGQDNGTKLYNFVHKAKLI